MLEGSVMNAEDRVRVTAQLIDGTNGYHLWSGRHDRTMMISLIGIFEYGG